MKRIVMLVVITSIFVYLTSFVSAFSSINNDVNALFNKYYYDGVYTKDTKIHLNDDALLEAMKYFHNECSFLERTTHYNKDKLWMFNDDLSINSGYGTTTDGMTHFYINDEGEEVVDYVVYGDSMEEHYITLYDFKEEKEINWEMYNGAYISYDEKAIEMFKEFCAPCFIGVNLDESNWLVYSHVTLEEYANSLRMKLYVSSTHRGFLSNDYTLFAEAIVTRGIDSNIYNETDYVLNSSIDNDLSKLKEVLGNIDSYVSKTKSYFNPLAIAQIESIYDMIYYDELTSVIKDEYMYIYSFDLGVNDVYYNHNNSLYRGSLQGYSLLEKLNSSISLSDLELFGEGLTYQDDIFTLKDIDDVYIDTYGETIITTAYRTDYYNGWKKIEEDIYTCDRIEVLKDFVNICSPTFTNGGMYMTYKYVVVDLSPDNGADIRIRLYTSTTQTGKIIKDHLNADNANWFLLAAEADIYSIGNASVGALENIII